MVSRELLLHQMTTQRSLNSSTTNVRQSIECVASEGVTQQKVLLRALVWLVGHILSETTTTSKWYQMLMHGCNRANSRMFCAVFNKLFPHSSTLEQTYHPCYNLYDCNNVGLLLSYSNQLRTKKTANIALPDGLIAHNN